MDEVGRFGEVCGCGKIKYPSKQAAWGHIMGLPQQRINRSSLTVYWCDSGATWHLRSDLRRGRQRKKRSRK